MTEEQLMLFVFAWFLAGFVNGISGLGAGMVALPIIASFMPSYILVPVTSMTVMFLCGYLGFLYRKHCNIKSVIYLSIGAIPGSILGGLILLYTPSSTIQLGAGTIMVLFVLWQLLPKASRVIPEKTIGTGIAGGISGFLNASISFSGPPIAIYAVTVGWSKEVTFANMNIAIVISCLMSAAVHASAGLYTWDMLPYFLWGIPATVIGVLAASPIAKRVNPLLFHKILLCVIGAAGCVCITRALS